MWRVLEKERKKGWGGGENKWEKKRGTGKEKGWGGGENKWEKKRGKGKEKGLRRRREQMEKEEGRERVRRREKKRGIGEEKVWGEEGAATTSGRVYLGPMTRVSQYCKALRSPSEPFSCCHNGKVSLPSTWWLPFTTEGLFDWQTAESSNFQDNIRQYNSAFSFTPFILSDY